MVKFFRRTSWYTLLDQKRSEEIFEDLTAKPVDDKLRRHKSNWLGHVTRIQNNRMPKKKVNYRPKGRRRLGNSMKGQLDEAIKAHLMMDDDDDDDECQVCNTEDTTNIREGVRSEE